MRNILYTCLIEERDHTKPFVQVYWAHAPRIGVAIEMMLDAAKKNGLGNPTARQIDPFDIENLRGEITPSTEADVFWSISRHYFSPEQLFELPTGIIPSCIEGPRDPDDIRACFHTSCSDQGMKTIEVNAEDERLFEDYCDLIRLFPKYKVFWYLLHDHWEETEDDLFLVNEALNKPELIIEHLKNYPEDSIQNGFVTLTAYVDEGSTNLNISDHKRIVIRTYSSVVADECIGQLESMGYELEDDPARIDFEMHHWHYRVHSSKSKPKLIAMLKDLGFSDWKPGNKQ